MRVTARPLPPRSPMRWISSCGREPDLEGRQELAVFTQQIFDTVVKGSRLEGEVKFVRFLSPNACSDALGRQDDKIPRRPNQALAEPGLNGTHSGYKTRWASARSEFDERQEVDYGTTTIPGRH